MMLCFRPMWIKGIFIFLLFLQSSIAFSGFRYKKDQDSFTLAHSLSGAYLAARLSFSEENFNNASVYYKRMAELDLPTFLAAENQEIREQFVVSLLLSGHFDDIIPFARKNSPQQADVFSLLALVVQAAKKSDYKTASHFMNFIEKKANISPWIPAILKAWIWLGEGKSRAAIGILQKLMHSEESEALQILAYHKALIQEAAGFRKEAKATYSYIIHNQAPKMIDAENGILRMRAIEAYARFLNQETKADRHRLTIEQKQDSLSSEDLAFQALVKNLKSKKQVRPMIESPAQGLAEAFFNIGVAVRIHGPLLPRIALNYSLLLKPDNDLVLWELGAYAEKGKDHEAAIRFYKKIPPYSSISNMAEIHIALNLSDLGRNHEAIARLKSMLPEDQNSFEIHTALGSIYSSQNDFHSAVKVYSKAISRLVKRTPENWKIFYRRGMAYERLKEWTLSEADLRKALELSPDQPHVMNYLAYSWIDMNCNLDEALKLIRKAVELRPRDSYIIDSLGWAYFRLGRFEEAVEQLEQAISLQPEEPTLNDHLGDAYWYIGRFRQAVFQWRYARDMKPEPKDLKKIEEKLRIGLPMDKPKNRMKESHTHNKVQPKCIPHSQ